MRLRLQIILPHLFGDAAGRCLQMADRDRQCIGGIVRGWRLGEAEQQLHHLLHLLLLGAAVADDRALDRPPARTTTTGRPASDGREQRDAARLTELQRAAHVAGVKDVFDGDAIGLMARDERLQPFVDCVQSVGEGRARRDPRATRR